MQQRQLIAAKRRIKNAICDDTLGIIFSNKVFGLIAAKLDITIYLAVN